MSIEFSGMFITQGSIAFNPTRELPKPATGIYYSFDDSIQRNVYYDSTFPGKVINFSQPVALEPGDTVEFNVYLTTNTFRGVFASGSGFEFGIDGQSNLYSVGCTIDEINSRIDPIEQQAFISQALAFTDTNNSRWLSVRLIVNTSTNINRLAGPQTGGPQGGASTTSNPIQACPFVNIRLNTVPGEYFWPMDNPAQNALQQETLQNGPDLVITSYNSALWVSTLINFNSGTVTDPGDNLLGSINISAIGGEPALIESSGNSIRFTNTVRYPVVYPVDLSTGFTIMYDAEFISLGNRNGNIRSGGVSSNDNSSDTNKFSLVADNMDGSGVTSIAFSLLNPTIYSNQSGYATAVISEVRDTAPVQLNKPYRIIAVARPTPVNTIELHIDGVLIGTNVYPTNYQDGSIFGGSFVSNMHLLFGNQFIDGVYPASETRIDEFRFYDRPLTAQELLAFTI